MTISKEDIRAMVTGRFNTELQESTNIKDWMEAKQISEASQPHWRTASLDVKVVLAAGGAPCFDIAPGSRLEDVQSMREFAEWILRITEEEV